MNLQFLILLGIRSLSPDVQEQLFNEIIDRDVQNGKDVILYFIHT